MEKNPTPTQAPWHLLQVSDVLDLELATALSEFEEVIAWEPQRTLRAFSVAAGDEAERLEPESGLRVRKLPLLRGFSRFPISLLNRMGPPLLDRMLAQTKDPERSPLICTVPYFAETAEQWPGPVIYWLTDLIAEYAGANRKRVINLDRRLCRTASLICPNSLRLAQYLRTQAECDPSRIHVIPNATREQNILATRPSNHPAAHPAFQHVPRPIAGVIGNLSSNMDWLLLEQMIQRLPHFSWVFIGPTSMPIRDSEQRLAREKALRHPRAFFLGPQPYGDLAGFARAFDVAVLPYKKREPTYSGSSTRFYEHLAACRPMIATRGLEELVRKPPMLRLFNTAEEGTNALLDLAAMNFNDGLIEARWKSSFDNSWRSRAGSMRTALADRLYGETTLPIAI